MSADDKAIHGALARRESELDETPAVDHALTVALAGLQALPVIGGVIATFIDEYVPRQKRRRLTSFVQDLSARLRAEADRVDREFVRTEDFSDLLEDVLDAAQQRRNEEKHRYYASAVANSLTPKRPDEVDREKMLEVLNALRTSHLRVIALYMTIEIPDSMLPLQGDMEHRIVHGSLPELTHEQVDGLILDLQTRGVLPLLAQSATAGDPHQLATQMTPFGRRFARWVEATTAEPITE